MNQVVYICAFQHTKHDNTVCKLCILGGVIKNILIWNVDRYSYLFFPHETDRLFHVQLIG